jgi:hypothetical protein
MEIAVARLGRACDEQEIAPVWRKGGERVDFLFGSGCELPGIAIFGGNQHQTAVFRADILERQDIGMI